MKPNEQCREIKRKKKKSVLSQINPDSGIKEQSQKIDLAIVDKT